MESDIKDAIAKLMIKSGRKITLELLAEKTGKSERTITRWIDQGIPDGHSAYLVALACGKTEEEALLIGQRHPLVAVKAREA